MKRFFTFLMMVLILIALILIACVSNTYAEVKEATASLRESYLSTWRNGIQVGEHGPIVMMSEAYVYLLNAYRDKNPDYIMTVKYDNVDGDNQFISFGNRGFENEIKKKIADLKSGKVEPTTAKEAAIKFDASWEQDYLSSPPIDGPIDDKQYYLWWGTLFSGGEGTYTVFDSGSDIWGNTYRRSFAFTNTKKKFIEMKVKDKVYVVGRYFKNTKLKLSNGETIIIPGLTDCYVGSQ